MSFLNRKIIGINEDSVGLSITDDRVRVVYLENGRIRGYNSIYLPDGSVNDGEILNKNELFKSIEKAFSESRPRRIKNKRVRIALSESKSFLRLISMPNMDEKEISEAIKWEIEANIPLALDQVYYDWQLVDNIFNEGQDEVKVLVLAAAKRIVDQHIEVLEEFGLEVIGIESETTALIRSLLSENIPDGRTSMIINIDKNKTSFIFAVKNIPCFASSIPVSEKNIINAIAKKFNISDQKAEEIERNDGIGSFFEDDALFEAIRPVLDGLVEEIKKTIDFYLDGLKYSNSLDEILICGKLSKSKGLIPYLSRSLGKEIVDGDVRRGMNYNPKDIPIINKDESIKYAIPIGLSLWNS